MVSEEISLTSQGKPTMLLTSFHVQNDVNMRLYRNPCTSIGPIFLGTWGSLIVHASCSYIHMGSLIVHPSCFYIHRGSLIINPSCSHIHRGSLIVHPSCSYIHRNHALHNILGLFFREVGFLHSQKPIYPVLIH